VALAACAAAALAATLAIQPAHAQGKTYGM
jgi:hypothetical protein